MAVTGIAERFLLVPHHFLISYKWLSSIEAKCVAPWRLTILKSDESDEFCAPSLPRSAALVLYCMPYPLLSYSFKLKAATMELRLSSVVKYCPAQ